MSKSKQSENELKEKLNQVGKDIIKLSADKKLSYDQAMMKAERSLLMLYSEGLKTDFEHIRTHLNQVIETLDKVHSGIQQPICLTTGLLDLDELLCGLNDGNLYIIGGSPAMGKTALALTILRHAAVQEKVPTGFFSLDLIGTKIALRLLCMESKVDSHLVRTGKLPKLQWKVFKASVKTLAKKEIFIDYTPSLSPLKMKHNAIRLKGEHNIKLLIVDYHPQNKRKIYQLNYRLLKQMAVELDIPVIVTSQLTRKPIDLENRRPDLRDFNHPVEIEKYADTIMLLYRPWMYSKDDEDRGKAKIIVEKNRYGSTGIVEVVFIDRYAIFENVPDPNFV